MDKQELINEIKRIPRFVLRDVAVQKGLDKEIGEDGRVRYRNNLNEWVEQEQSRAVTEEGQLKALTYVSKSYQLVQFYQVYAPLIENIPSLDGKVTYWQGMGVMDVFPDDEKLKVNGGDRIGLVAINSVNTTSSVMVKFCVNHDNRIITIPKGIAGFKRMHIGKAFQMTQNFLVVVDKIRGVWRTILDEFSKLTVDEGYCRTMLDDIKINEEYLRKKVLKKVMSEKMDVWDVFMYMMEIVEGRSFKSDFHRWKKMDLVSEKMFKWAIACRLINA